MRTYAKKSALVRTGAEKFAYMSTVRTGAKIFAPVRTYAKNSAPVRPSACTRAYWCRIFRVGAHWREEKITVAVLTSQGQLIFSIRQEVSEEADRFDASVKMFGPKR